MTAEPAERRSVAASPLARPWLAAAAAAVTVWCALLGFRTAAGLPDAWAAARRGLGEPAALRIERASGISPALAAAIRAALPEDGRLVVYSPYGGQPFELDGGDPRGEPARLVRGLFERVKNLLYPRPRDVRFARDAGELRNHVDPALAGRLCVIDGTQEPVELAVGGAYELLFEEPGRIPRLRLWRLRRPS